MSVRVTLTAAHRDAIHHEIREYSLHGRFDDIETMLARPTRGIDAQELWAEVSLTARVLDAIGWDCLSSEASYEVELDEMCVEWVRARLAMTQDTLADNSKTLRQVRSGRDPWAGYGSRTPVALAQDVAQLEAMINADLELVHACRSILSQEAR